MQVIFHPAYSFFTCSQKKKKKKERERLCSLWSVQCKSAGTPLVGLAAPMWPDCFDPPVKYQSLRISCQHLHNAEKSSQGAPVPESMRDVCPIKKINK